MQINTAEFLFLYIQSMNKLPEFDKHGRYIESPCFGCDLPDCSICPRSDRDD